MKINSQTLALQVRFLPAAKQYQKSLLRWQIDGVVQPIGFIAKQAATKVVVRMKVLAKLLTYETHLPREGRIAQDEYPLDIRVSTFPTIFGEKVVARFLQSGNLSGILTGLAESELARQQMRRGLYRCPPAWSVIEECLC